MTAVVFWAAVSFSLFSLWLLPAMATHSWVFAGLSTAFNLWCVYQSDRGGFVRSRHAPRVKEPPRHFTPLQTAVVFILLLIQFGLMLYFLLYRTHLLDQVGA